jgi:hypothetical protein
MIWLEAHPVLADAIGLFGSALMVIGYAYSNLSQRVDFVLFNLLNLIGAILLFASLLVHFNLASMILEIVWGAIALLGLVKALLDRKRA